MLRVVVCPFIGQKYRAPCPVCVFSSADTHTDGDALRHATRLLYKECSLGHGFLVCTDRHWSSGVYNDHEHFDEPRTHESDEYDCIETPPVYSTE